MAANSDKSILNKANSTMLLKLFCPCLLLTSILLVIFIFTSSIVATANALHSHENGGASQELPRHITHNLKSRSSLHETPRTLYTPSRGRKMMKTEAASWTVDHSQEEDAKISAAQKHFKGKKQVEKKKVSQEGRLISHNLEIISNGARKDRSDMDSFVSCADYGRPRRHPPKNN